MNSKHIAMLVCASSTAIFSMSGQTQESGVAARSILEEIIVTAEKRSQNLQDVPVAVTAFTDQAREEIGIVSIQDFTKFTPGLTYSTNLDRITLRGIGRFTNNLAADPGVAVYADNVYTSSTTEAGKDPLFVERTEILRGPQGTLYGRNSIGGAINVISKRPTDEFSAEIRGSVANYDRTQVSMLLRGPLNDNVRYLIGVSSLDQKEGYFTNVNGGPDEGGVADDQFYVAQLEANFGNFGFWLKYQRSTWDQSRRSLTRPNPYDTDLGLNGIGTGTALLPTGSLGPTALYNTGVGYIPPATNIPLFPAAQQYTAVNPGVTDNRKFRTNTPFQATLDDNDNLALDMTYHFDGVDLRYTGGRQHYIYEQESDFDNTDREFYDYTDPFFFRTVRIYNTSIQNYKEDKTWSSHEVNISSTYESSMQWLVGLYKFREEYSQPLMIYNPDQTNLATPCISYNYVSCAPGLYTPSNPDQAYYSANTDMDDSHSQAIYAGVNWDVTDRWSTAAGLRYTKDYKSLVERTRYVRWNPTFNGNAPALDITSLLTTDGLTSRRLKNSWSAYTGDLGVQWAATDDMLAFAKYTRGYKSGGFNSGTISAVPDVKEEVMDAYEIGWKATFMDNLQINTALFYYDYQDFQSVVSVVPETAGPLRSDFLNLAKAESMGFELETTWVPIDGLTLLFNYSYQQSEIKDLGKYDNGVPILLNDSTDPTAVGPNANRTAPVAGSYDPVTGNQRWNQDIAGNPMPGSPKHKFALNVRYTFNWSAGSLTLSASDTWRDETNYSLFNDPGSTADAFNQVDVRALWVDSDDRYSVIAYVQNALDEEGYDGMIDARADDGTVYSNPGLTAPRTYGLELQYRFGAK